MPSVRKRLLGKYVTVFIRQYIIFIPDSIYAPFVVQGRLFLLSSQYNVDCCMLAPVTVDGTRKKI